MNTKKQTFSRKLSMYLLENGYVHEKGLTTTFTIFFVLFVITYTLVMLLGVSMNFSFMNGEDVPFLASAFFLAIVVFCFSLVCSIGLNAAIGSFLKNDLKTVRFLFPNKVFRDSYH